MSNPQYYQVLLTHRIIREKLSAGMFRLEIPHHLTQEDIQKMLTWILLLHFESGGTRAEFIKRFIDSLNNPPL